MDVRMGYDKYEDLDHSAFFSFLLPFGHELYEGLDGVQVEVLSSDHSLEKIALYSLSLKFSFTFIP